VDGSSTQTRKRAANGACALVGMAARAICCDRGAPKPQRRASLLPVKVYWAAPIERGAHEGVPVRRHSHPLYQVKIPGEAQRTSFATGHTDDEYLSSGNRLADGWQHLQSILRREILRGPDWRADSSRPPFEVFASLRGRLWIVAHRPKRADTHTPPLERSLTASPLVRQSARASNMRIRRRARR
jgi:hypothetical protein